MPVIGITDHLEGPADGSSERIYREVEELAGLADSLGALYFWLAEHHAHAHRGHLPAPLLATLHLAGRTRTIRPGTAILCLNLHSPLDVAEQVATADLLSGGRLAVGFGSGSTPEEAALFHRPDAEADRHARFAEALDILRRIWSGRFGGYAGRFFNIPACRPLPIPAADLASRCWCAVNSVEAARIAGSAGFNMLFSHLRTPNQYREYRETYRAAGGRGLVAANRPVYVGESDESAWAECEGALRTLWRRFQAEGKVAPELREPADPRELCGPPIHFIVGGAESVARALLGLHAQVPFDVANCEVRWDGLSREQVLRSLERLLTRVRPLLEK